MSQATFGDQGRRGFWRDVAEAARRRRHRAETEPPSTPRIATSRVRSSPLTSSIARGADVRRFSSRVTVWPPVDAQKAPERKVAIGWLIVSRSPEQTAQKPHQLRCPGIPPPISPRSESRLPIRPRALQPLLTAHERTSPSSQSAALVPQVNGWGDGELVVPGATVTLCGKERMRAKTMTAAAARPASGAQRATRAGSERAASSRGETADTKSGTAARFARRSSSRRSRSSSSQPSPNSAASALRARESRHLDACRSGSRATRDLAHAVALHVVEDEQRALVDRESVESSVKVGRIRCA